MPVSAGYPESGDADVSISEVPKDDQRAVRKFVALEQQFVTDEPLYVAETKKDVVRRLMGRSHFFEQMEHVLLQARRGAKVTACCSALINHRYQQDRDAEVGFIGHFAAAADGGPDVRRLLSAAELWLKDRGVKRVVGPYNGAAMLGMGLLTDAFDQSPMFPLRWTPPYFQNYLLENGYRASYPFWIYQIDFKSEKFQTEVEQGFKNKNIHVRAFNKRQWAEELELLRNLFNETFRQEWEFHNHTREEFHEFFDPLKLILDPHQLLFGEVDGRPVGWCLGFPDWTPLFRSFRGKLGLPQMAKLLLRAKRYDRAGLVGIGVLPAYQGSGLARTLAVTLFRYYQARGLDQALYYAVNENNTRSRDFAESLGGHGKLMYHCYDKQIG